MINMHWRLVFIVSGLVFLQSCAQPEPKELPVVEIEPPVIIEKLPPVAEKPAVKPVEKPIAVVAPPRVVILVSDKTTAYSEVAKALAKGLGKRASIRYMKGNQARNIKMLSEYKGDERIQLVSIGLSASVAAKTLKDKQVIFCQVFNYHEHGLVTDKHKGVSMLPSMSQTFKAWRALAPNTTNISIITGSGFENMIKTAQSAAKKFGITLHHNVVNSDKEFQYTYKNIANKVQGYWILPDNRVLSGSVLRDVMTFSVRNSKQVAVFSEELLNLGGLFSVTSDNLEVAQKVLKRLEQGASKDNLTGPEMTYLDRGNLSINAVMAKRLNLTIPKQYVKYANSPK